MADKSTIELICDQIQGLFEARTWQTLNTPSIFQGLSLYAPDVQSLPLITILPRLAKVESFEYGEIICSQAIEITALIPHDSGESESIGNAVAAEMIEAIYLTRINGKWSTFPGAVIDLKLLEFGINQYPDQMNPQLMQAGITIDVLYELELYPAKINSGLVQGAWEDQ